MDVSGPSAPRPFNNSDLIKMKEITPLNQLMTCKASHLQRLVEVVLRVTQKSCRRALQLFCFPSDILLSENIRCCPAQNHQHTEEQTAQLIHRTQPSTIYIVNINNSTLIDCVIGNDTYLPSAVAESQPLMQGSKLQMHDQARCSCIRGQQGATSAPPPLCHPFPSAEPPSISIHSSHLNCVIIGDNNYMHADQTHPTDPEEP